MTDSKFHVVKDNCEITWLTGFEFICTLPDEFKQYAQMKCWCEENLEHVVAFLGRGGVCSYCDRGGYRREENLYFFSETDAAAFKLRWT